MARTALTVQTIVDEGIAPTFAAANVDGNSIPGDGDTYIEVINGSGGSINVTVQTGGTYEGEAVTDKVVAVGAGARKKIGRFKPRLYNQAAGTVFIDYSAVTDVTVAAFNVAGS